MTPGVEWPILTYLTLSPKAQGWGVVLLPNLRGMVGYGWGTRDPHRDSTRSRKKSKFGVKTMGGVQFELNFCSYSAEFK